MDNDPTKITKILRKFNRVFSKITLKSMTSTPEISQIRLPEPNVVYKNPISHK